MTPTNNVSTLLVVDDVEHSRYVTKRLLENAGYRTVEAATGTAALRLCEEQLPALVVLDINLPDLDGVEVCRRLKRRPGTAKILVILTTATIRVSHVGDLLKDCGADAYVTDEMANAQLVSTVRSLLRGRQS